MENSDRTVLVIADGHDDVEPYQRLLQRHAGVSYRVVTETYEGQIPDQCQLHAVDAILLAFHNPDTRGLDLLEQLRVQMGDRCPPVIVVGNSDADMAKRAFKGGATDYLIKDRLTPDQLGQSLQDVMPALDGCLSPSAAIAQDRQSLEASLRECQAELAAERQAIEQLSDMSSRLIQDGDPSSLYGQMLDMAIALMQADAASLQRFDPERNKLYLLSWRGFDPEAAAFWEWVWVDSGSSCGMALKAGERVIVPDIETCDDIRNTPDYDFLRLSRIRSVQTTPLRSRSGHLVGMISTHWHVSHEPSPKELARLDVLARQVADLMERQQEQKSLQQSSELLAIAMEAANGGWGNWNWLTGEAEWSDRGKLIMGFTSDAEAETVDGWLHRIHPEDRPRVEAHAAEVARGRRNFDMDYRIIHPNGDIRWLRGTGRIIYDSSGKPVRSTGFVFDLTERQRAEATLRQQAEELEQANQALEDALEELRITEEELRQQNEELAIARDLAEREGQRYLDLFNFAPDGYVVTNAAGVIREANWAIATLVTTDQHFLINTPLAVYFSKPDQQAFRNLLRNLNRLPEAEKLYTDELSLKRSDGSIVPVDITGTTICDAQARVVGIRWLIQDIAERKHREANAAFLAAIATDLSRLSSADEILHTVGAKIGEYLNLSVCSFTEIDAAMEEAVIHYAWHRTDAINVIGAYRISDFVTEEFLQAAQNRETIVVRDTNTDPRTDAEKYAALKVGSFISVPFHKDGQWKFLLNVYDSAPHNWRTDEIDLICELAEQVFPRLERARAEDALRDSEARFRSLTTSLPQLIWTSTPDGTLDYLSQQYAEYLGQIPEQLDDWNWHDIVHPDDLPNTLQEWERSLQVGEPIEIQHRLRHQTGAWRWQLVRGTPIRNRAGQITKWVGTCTDIQNEMDIMAALQDSEKQSRQILESISDGFCALDEDWRFIYVNRAAERILNLAPNDLIGKVVWDEYPGLYGSEFERIYRDAMGDRQPGSIVAFYPDHGRWYAAHAYPAPQGITIYFQDVTTQIEAETALRQSEERLRLATEAAQMGTWDLDLTTGEVIWSENHFPLFGYEPIPSGETSYKMWVDRIHPEDRKKVVQAWRQAKRNHQLYRAEYRVIRADNGTIAWLAALGSFTYDQTGKAVRSLGVVFDITARKQSEVIVRESEERFQLIAKATNDVMWDYDVATQTLWWSERMQTVFGYPPEAIEPGMSSWANRVHPADLKRVNVSYQACLKSDAAVWTQEYRFRRADGSYADVLDQAYIIRDAGRKPLRVVGAMSDITERKQAEVEREHLLERERTAREEAESANRVKDEFLAILSHELRSPLNPILGWSKLLQTQKLDEAKVSLALATIERNARLQTQLINDLLDVAKILRGKLELTENCVNLISVVEAALEVVRTAAEAKSISLQTTVLENCLVRGDDARLQQVVWNLLSNAIKFSPRGGQVKVCLESANGYARVTVSDTGKGISPDFLPRLFEAFRQEDASITRKYGGLGLGLSIAKYLIEAHGGTIAADSPGEGLGATFTVELPLLSEEPMILPDGLSSRTDVDLTGMKVLAVDDQEDTRELLAMMLTQYGADARVVASGREVLVLLRSFKPDALVCDIGMPGMDGYTLLQQVRSLSPEQGGQVRAIALTAFAREDDAQRALASGYQQHIPKPIEPDRLAIALAKLVRS